MASVKIGPYETVETISASGQALSYRAIHTTLGREVFLKVLPTGGEHEKERRARFEQEARALATVDHPAVVRVYEFGEWQGMLYLASEFLSGPDLGKLIKEKGPLEWSAVREMAGMLLDGLQKLHEAHIIHRDIKPTNIVLGKDGPKLADLGLARVTESPVATQSDTLLGSPAYMAPEILRGVPAGPKTDLFSLGASLFEVLTGERAFQGETFQQVLANLARCDPLTDRAHHLSAEARRFLSALLAKDPARRPGTAQQARLLLEGNREAQLVTREPQRRRLHELILIPLVMVVLAVAIWRLLPSPKPRLRESPIMADSAMVLRPAEPVEGQANSRGPADAPSTSPDTLTAGGHIAIHQEPQTTEPHESPRRSASAARVAEEQTSPPKEQPVEPAQVWVFCSPWGEVSLNGVVKDTTPLSSPLTLEPGEYTLRFTHPAFPSVERTLFTTSGQEESLYVSLPDSAGYVRIQSVPWANISVDGSAVGTTPIAEPLVLTPGIHSLAARNPFYEEKNREFTVARGETVLVAIHFEQELER